MGVVVGSSATFREISTGRVLILLSGATNSLISFTWVCSMIGDRSVALITATLSGTSFLAPNYKTINRTSYNIIYTHLLSCTLSCLALVLEKLITPLNQTNKAEYLIILSRQYTNLSRVHLHGKGWLVLRVEFIKHSHKIHVRCGGAGWDPLNTVWCNDAAVAPFLSGWSLLINTSIFMPD